MICPIIAQKSKSISKSLLSYVDQFFCSMNLLYLEEMSLCPWTLGCCFGYSRANDAACVASVEIFMLQPLTGAISDEGKSTERLPDIMLITNIFAVMLSLLKLIRNY